MLLLMGRILAAGLFLFAGASHAQVVISQVYGAGGNSGATLRSDYIELHNNGTTAVNLSAWSVQYTSSAGTTWTRTNLTGSIAAGGYFLVKQADGTGGTATLPTPDTTGTIAMSGTAGKIALVNTQITLAGSCPLGGAVVDFIGYGTAANCSETAPTAAPPNNASAAIRVGNGCTDTGNNSNDFAFGPTNPRNTASPAVFCSSSANLSIVKSSSVTLLQSGMMQYTITASNAGPSAVTGARIQDAFAGSLSSITWSCTPTGGATCANGTGNVDQLVNMPVSSTVVYSITATLATPFPNSITNTATITSPVGTPDPVAGNNTSTVVDELILFRDGFEDAGPIAPSLISLLLARVGITETLVLSLADVRRLAINANPVEVVSFDIEGTLAVVQSRQVGGELQVRLLQRNVNGNWVVGSRTDLGTAGGDKRGHPPLR